MKKPIRLILLALVSCFFAGCMVTESFEYPADAKKLVCSSSVPVQKKKVAVVPFEDRRQGKNSNRILLAYVPFVPYGTIKYERPEIATRKFLFAQDFDCKPTEDLAEASALSLRHSNLFEDAFFTFGGEKDDADFILSGHIRRMRYSGKMYTYCLAGIGTFLWIFGAPVGESENELEVDLILKNKAGKTLWNYSIEGKQAITQWLYSGEGKDLISFPRIYQDGMNAALRDLAQKMKREPELFR